MTRLGLKALAGALTCLLILASGNPLRAQDDGGDDGGGQTAAGVRINAEGVLNLQVFRDRGGALAAQRKQGAMASREAKLNVVSPMRKISLNRLEKAIEEKIDGGLRLPDDMRNLVGLTRVEYVFFYPETGDIVIAGPAEPWYEDLSGRVVGVKSGRPVVELQDLIVALRAYPAGKHRQSSDLVVGCSIDPTQEGLARMQQFLRQIGARATPADTQFIVNGLRQNLGLQTVSVLGVPADTHFAQVMVEADYRMKLIGIGLERPPVKMTSYVDRASPSGVSRNALQRWYFLPDYECLRVSDDQLALQLVGDGVKLIGEDEYVAEDGARGVSRKVDAASQAFVSSFTKKYSELAAKSPVYAQLRNLIDLLVVSAFIQKHDFYRQAGWNAETLNDEGKIPVQVYPAVKHADTAVNSLWKGNRLMTPVGGGVHIEAQMALNSENLLKDEAGKVQQARQQLDLSNLPAGQWWWD